MLSDGKKCTLEPKLNGGRVISSCLTANIIKNAEESKQIDCGPETLTYANEIDMPHYSFYTW